MTDYKTPVVFLRLSKSGKQVFAFNIDGRLGGTCKSVIVNVADLAKVLDGSAEYAKLSIMPESGGDTAEDDLSSSPSCKEQSTLPGGSVEETKPFGNLDSRKEE